MTGGGAVPSRADDQVAARPPVVPDPAAVERHTPLPRAALAEFVGTAMLLAAIVGSGIMAETRSPADAGLQLLEAAVATGAVLAAIIVALGPVSGAHLNPCVTLADRVLGRMRWPTAAAYVTAQAGGAVAGVVVANVMIDGPAVSISTTSRSGVGQWVGEVVATYGLVLIIFSLVRARASLAAIAVAVGGYIAGAYVFTSSTSFANPAITLARTLTDTFAGIAPADVAAFVAAQLLGTLLAVGTVTLLHPPPPNNPA